MQPPQDPNLVAMLGLLAGGLAVFLFGLQLLTDGLKTIAGPKLPVVLGRLTSNRVKGAFAGAAITALLNSSTITTVLLVGFVSAGLMTLAQSVPMIMGANIGSTFTAQVIAFDVSAFTPFMLAIGFFTHAFAKRELFRHLGAVVLGLGLLFLGIQFMGEATHPLRTYQPFIDLMQNMKNPLLGIVIGAVFTAVVQSSAATLAIIIALASQGLMPLEAGIALVLGANIGTCGTALLAAIGKSAEALQVGVVHLLFNVLGVLFFVFLIPQTADLIRTISPSAPELEGVARLAAETPRQVANTHTLFSVASTLILIWFVGPLARLAQRIAPAQQDKAVSPGEPRYLDDASLAAASLGLHKVRLEIGRLGELVLAMVRQGATVPVLGQPHEIEGLRQEGTEVDRLGAAILNYIGKLSEQEHSEEESQQIVELTEIVSLLESIGEIVSTNLVATAHQRLADGVDLARLRDESTSAFASFITQGLERTVAVFREPDPNRPVPPAPTKLEIESMAVAARKNVLGKIKLADMVDVLGFRLANDMIEQFRQIGRLTLRIAESAQRG